MKVLFASTLYYPHNIGGAEGTVRLLTQAALAHGDEPVVVTLSPGAGEEGAVDDTPVHYLPLSNLGFPVGTGARPVWQKLIWHAIDAYNPVMAARLGRIIDRVRPDVVSLHNVQGFSAAAWDAVTRRKIPAVQTLHDYYTGCLNSTMYRHGRNCAKPCAECALLALPRRRLSKRLDGVTAVSRRQLERIEAAGIFDGVADKRVIHGCNAPADHPSLGPEERKPGGKLRLGFLGRLDPIKGLDWALETISSFSADEITVSVAGRGEPSYEALLRGAFGPPQVEFCGFVDPAAWFSTIDLLIVPSLWEEPLGRVVHEGFSYGVPTLGAALGGVPEIVKEGETGFLFRGNDPADLTRVLRSLLVDRPDWHGLSQRCREAAGNFSLQTIYAQYRAAWDSAIARRRNKGGIGAAR